MHAPTSASPTGATVTPATAWMRARPSIRAPGPCVRVAAAAALATVFVAVLALTAPATTDRLHLAGWGQAVVEALACGACARTAASMRGRPRLVWALFAVSQGLWALTDAAFTAAQAAGLDVPEVSVFDAGWLAFYLPSLAGVALLYRGLRGEPGWQGVLDGLLLTLAVGVFSWHLVLQPVAEQGSGGPIGTLVNLLYPSFDLIGLSAVGWLVVRHRRESPDWLCWIAGAFGVQVAADLLYLVGALHHVEVEGALSGVTYMAGACLWLLAAGRARLSASREWRAREDAPPTWSTAIPCALASAMVLLVARGAPVSLAAPAVAGVALATARLIATVRINRRLHDQRRGAEERQAALRRLAIAVAEDSGSAGDDVAAPVALVAAREAAAILSADEVEVVRFEGAAARVVGSWGRDPGAPSDRAGPATAAPRATAPISMGGRPWGAIVAGGGPAASVEECESDLRSVAELMSLAVANADARARRRGLERAKDEFISVASHELRTPLSSIRMALDLLEEDDVDSPEERARILGIAMANTDRLVRLIDDLLDIRRLEAGAMQLELRPCRVEDLLCQTVALMEDMAARSSVGLAVERAGGSLWADPERLQQTLVNLVGNAIKFSPPGGLVRLSAEPRGETVVISVADRGRGIPADQLESIFERFRPVDASDFREKGGTGLGLAISRSIVEAHGGRIWAESEWGGGSTFLVALPAGPPS